MIEHNRSGAFQAPSHPREQPGGAYAGLAKREGNGSMDIMKRRTPIGNSEADVAVALSIIISSGSGANLRNQ